MSKNGLRINLASVASGVISLVSVFEPWWGISISSPIVSTSILWSLTTQPANTAEGGAGYNAAFAQAMSTYSPIILILVLLSVAIALLGSLSTHRGLLAASLVSSLGALIGYLALLTYAFTQNCQGNGCIRQVTGSQSAFSFTLSWGFQAGFYIFLAGTIVLIGAIALHKRLTRTTH